MNRKTAENYIDYQERATEFALGDLVMPVGLDESSAGRVTAVWPAIGMVDVEFTVGNKRCPVEDLIRLDPEKTKIIPPQTDSVPGGSSTSQRMASSSRIAEAFVKKALYWHAADRQYRATQSEAATGHYTCPKCKIRGQESVLRPAAYKRREGVSEKLLGCPECLFLVKKTDIVNCPGNVPEVVETI